MGFHDVVVEPHLHDVEVGFDAGDHGDAAVDAALADLGEHDFAGEVGHVAVEEDDVDVGVECVEGFLAAAGGSEVAVLGEPRLVEPELLGHVVDCEDRHDVEALSHHLGRVPSPVCLIFPIE